MSGMRVNGFNPSGAAWQQQPASACDPAQPKATAAQGQVSVPQSGLSQTATSQPLDNGVTIFQQAAPSSDVAALKEQFNLVFGFIAMLFNQFKGQSGATAPNTVSASTGNASQSTINPFSSVGNLGGLNNRPVGQKQMVVLDDAETGHAQTVMDVANQILLRNGIQQVKPSFVQQKVQNPKYQGLSQAVDALLSGSLNDRADEITRLTQSGKVGVVNISNGLSPVDIMQQLANLSQSNPAALNDMKSVLGLGDSANKGQLYQKLAQYIGQKMGSSNAYQQALQRYQQATQFAENNGVAVVVAAGNSADELAAMRQAGLSIDDELGLNLLTNSNNVINVGAVNDQGTEATGDDQAAAFSSPGNRIQFAANGVNVLSNRMYEGTSYSAPQVSGLIASLQAENPNLSVSQIRQILTQTASKHASISSLQEGAGTVQWGNALQLGMQVA